MCICLCVYVLVSFVCWCVSFLSRDIGDGLNICMCVLCRFVCLGLVVFVCVLMLGCVFAFVLMLGCVFCVLMPDCVSLCVGMFVFVFFVC